MSSDPGFERLAVMDLQVKLAGMDEMETMLDKSVEPKPPGDESEAHTIEGEPFDMMLDTPNLNIL